MGLPYVKKNEPWSKPQSYTKINLKWVIDANVKHKGIKLLEEKIGKNVHDLVLEMMPEA